MSRRGGGPPRILGPVPHPAGGPEGGDRSSSPTEEGSVDRSPCRRARRRPVRWLLLLSLVAAPGCGSWGRAAYDINQAVDTMLFTPIVQIYVIAVPEPAREGISNFLGNIRYVDTVINQALQGKPGLALQDFGRLAVNSTLGIGGFLDVASDMGFEKHDEDFGQTLAVWGVPSGEYMVLPLLGPTTMRDSLAFAFSFVTSPSLYVDIPVVSPTVTVLSYVNRRLEATEGIAFAAREAADPYEFTKQAWLQRRQFLIHDGNPPEPEIEGLDDLDLDDLEGLDDLGPGDGALEPEPPSATDDLPGLDDLRVPGEHGDLPGLDDLEPGPSASEPRGDHADLPDLDDF